MLMTFILLLLTLLTKDSFDAWYRKVPVSPRPITTLFLFVVPGCHRELNATKNAMAIYLNFCWQGTLDKGRVHWRVKSRQWLFCRRRQFTLRDYFAVSCL